MDIAVSVATLAVVAVAIQFAYKQLGNSSSVTALSTIRDGRKADTQKGSLPDSFNQPQGETFSQAAWIRVDDFSYRYGQPKIIFSKGSDDASIAGPALLLDPHTNALLIKMDTFGTQETFAIPNIPAKKWIHVVVAVNQDAVDVQVNGILKSHHTLTQLPRQNTGQLYISPGGGFDGKIGSLDQYAQFVTPADAQSLSASSPSAAKGEEGIGPLPQQFGSSWYVN